jgi:hypothetical protein
MSWANLKELIFQERKILDATNLPEFPEESAFETQQSALLASYLKTKPEVDAAVNTFAQALEWPPLTSLETFFLVARLDFAWEIVSILNTDRDGELPIAYPTPSGLRAGCRQHAHFPEALASVTFRAGDNGLRSALGHNMASSLTRFWAKIDNPIGTLNQIQIVFDHHHAMPLVDEALENLEQNLDIGKV